MTGFRADTFYSLGSLFIRDALNTLAEIGEVWVRDHTNTLQKIWSSAGAVMTVEALDVYGAVSSNTPRRVTTNPVDMTVTGGVSPYTYSWSTEEGWDVYGGAMPNARFTSPPISAWNSEAASFTCTITDSVGTTATVTVNASCDNFGGSGVPV